MKFRRLFLLPPGLFTILLVTSFSRPSLISQEEAIDLLKDFDPTPAVVIAGEWQKVGGELAVKPSKAARIALRGELPDAYDLTIEFTRVKGEDSVVVILPVGDVSPALELSAWQGEAHGLSRIDELPVKAPDHPAAKRPGKLENGRRYLLNAKVNAAGAEATVQASLDGEALFTWNGKPSRLSSNVVLNLSTPRTLGLAAHESEVVFHRVELRDLSTQAPSVPETTVTKKPEDEWLPFNGARFEMEKISGREILRAIPGSGTGDRGFWKRDLSFSEGTIEVDLKGANVPGKSFLGVVFHGEDGDSYEAVYFRPFNFAHADPVRRGHAVQYIAHPDWPWDRLRKEMPEQYENPAVPEPKPDEWFRARIEVENGRIKAFVNGADTPSLEVKSLINQKEGKVGLWFNGIAEFSDFRITPD